MPNSVSYTLPTRGKSGAWDLGPARDPNKLLDWYLSFRQFHLYLSYRQLAYLTAMGNADRRFKAVHIQYSIFIPFDGDFKARSIIVH